MMNWSAICLFVASWWFISATANNATRPAQVLFTKATKHMNPSDVEQLKTLNCKVTGTNERVDDGIAKWEKATLECDRPYKNLHTSIVICDQHCIDPARCKRMPHLTPWPVLHEKTIYFLDTAGEEHSVVVDLPIACECRLLNNKSPACPSKKRKRNRNRHGKKKRRN